MIRTEIDITNPQKVEVIETGEIGYVTLYDGEDDNSPFLVCRKNGEEIHWFNPEELRPFEDRLMFDVVQIFMRNEEDDYVSFTVLRDDMPSFLDNYTYEVIATPKEKSLEDMTKEQLIEMVKQLKK